MKVFKLIPIIFFVGTLLLQGLGVITMSMSSLDKLNLLNNAASFVPR